MHKEHIELGCLHLRKFEPACNTSMERPMICVESNLLMCFTGIWSATSKAEEIQT